MKKINILFAGALIAWLITGMTGCSSNATSEEAKTDTTEQVAPVEPAAPAEPNWKKNSPLQRVLLTLRKSRNKCMMMDCAGEKVLKLYIPKSHQSRSLKPKKLKVISRAVGSHSTVCLTTIWPKKFTSKLLMCIRKVLRTAGISNFHRLNILGTSGLEKNGSNPFLT